MDHNLWRIFAAVAQAVPERQAIVTHERSITYRRLAERSARLANVLSAHGLGSHTPRDDLAPWEIGQDSVGLQLVNGPEYLEASLGGYAARAAPFNVNHRYVAEELRYLLDDAGPAALVFHARYAPTLADVLPRLRRAPRLLLQVADPSGQPLLPGALDYEEALAAATPDPPLLDHHPDDAYLLYTGGTTGMPKCTIWRQADFWLSGVARSRFGEDDDLDTIVRAAREAEGQRIQVSPPFVHGAAHLIGLSALLGGETVVLNRVVDRLDPHDFWTTVETQRVTLTVLVGEAFARPLITCFEAGAYDASSLQLVVSGGAATTPQTTERFLAALPHAMYADLAGASELGGGLAQVSAAGTGRPEAGVFAAQPDVAILDEGLTRRLEPGHVGIGWYAKQGRVMLGYLGDRAKTEATLPVVEGVRWAVPGDRARLRAHGLVELLGRDSVTINSGGEKVFAEEVERAMLAHAAVADAVVVGRPSERWGEEVVAVVQLVPGAVPDDDELRATAGTLIARYKLPKAIVRVPQLRRSPAGKADYRWAREQAAPDAAATPGQAGVT